MVYSNGDKFISIADNRPIYTYTIGSDSWTQLPVNGAYAIIDADSISFLTLHNNFLGTMLNLYNLSTDQQTQVYEFSPNFVPADSGRTLFAYSKPNYFFLTTENGLDTATVFDTETKTKTVLFQSDSKHKITDVSIFGRTAGLLYYDFSTHLSYVITCDF